MTLLEKHQIEVALTNGKLIAEYYQRAMLGTNPSEQLLASVEDSTTQVQQSIAKALQVLSRIEITEPTFKEEEILDLTNEIKQ